MSTIDEVGEALDVIAFAAFIRKPRRVFRISKSSFEEEGRDALSNGTTLLHCTSFIPANATQTNLRAMTALKDRFCLPVGYSDHTEVMEVSLVNCVGRCCNRKTHLTLDRTMNGPDHFCINGTNRIHGARSVYSDYSRCLRFKPQTTSRG